MTSDDRTTLRVEPCRKRIRAYFGGQAVADTTQSLLVWEHSRYPVYYIPAADVRTDLLEPSGRSSHRHRLGDARLFTITAGGRTAEDAAWQYEQSPVEAVRGFVRFDWSAMDAWFEEDEEVYTHARDPYTRIDVLASSRTVRVELDGEAVAESRSPRLLFETGLITRYYLPMTDLRADLLGPGTTTTHCPYKGTAEHLSVRVGDTWHTDVAWVYRAPFPESQKIAGLVSFYNERGDLLVDGVLQPRPRTAFG
ncbi:DUF427 domain-containing protein [Kitasatospora sp. NPDC059571]|uniref:DUF427 domain-containing protein n=1 Tax=Kitasatospora sp. NPDC059571 TaxID=3346871 RepID=UPI00368044AE